MRFSGNVSDDKRRVFQDVKGIGDWHPRFHQDFHAWLTNGYPDWRKEWETAHGRHPSEYSLLFSYAFPDTDGRQGFIEHLVNGCEPGPGYIYIAGLALADVFRTFLTTNFDDLIHDALFRYGGLKPMVCAFDSQVSSIRLQSPRPKIIKLHGDFLYSNVRNVGAEVSRLDVNMEEKFARTCESHGLIVAGYGGGDQSVMAPIRTMLHRGDRLTHGLHWCVYRRDHASFVSVPEELNRMWEAYPDKVHLYAVGGFDDVMAALFHGCECRPPPELAQPREKALYSRLRDGLENADQTWRLSARFSDLMAGFREANLQEPPVAANRLDEADREHRIASEELRAGRFQSAKSRLEQCVVLVNAVLQEPSLSHTYRIWALRRRSGAHASLAESIWKACQVSSGAGIPARVHDDLAGHVNKAVGDARDGLRVTNDDRILIHVTGHIRNLYFNGLIGLAYLLCLGKDLAVREREDALEWLTRLMNDERFGDEYVTLLSEEIGGADLIAACARWAQPSTVAAEPQPSQPATSTSTILDVPGGGAA